MKNKDTARILIVDDQIHALQGMSRIMKGAGYEVLEASNGQDCLKLAAEHKPDLILLDIVLPDIDGREVCRRIKSDPETADIYVVLFSSMHIDSDSQAEGLEHGADGYIARPIPNRELLARVKSILRLKYAETRFSESEKRIYEMFEKHNAIMILIEPETGKIIHANKAAELFYGYPMSQLCSMYIQDINILPPEEVKDKCHLASTEGLNSFIFPHRVANGEVRTVEVHSTPIEQDGKSILFSIIHDITDRKKAEEDLRQYQKKLEELVEERTAQLQKSEQKFRSIFENTINGVLFSSPDGSIYDANPEACQILGRTREELCELGRSAVVDETDPRLPIALERMRKQGRLVANLNFKRADGATFPAEASSSIFLDARGNERTIIEFSDITERQRLEKELLESEQRYRSLFEHMLEGFAYCRMFFEDGKPLDFTYLKVNKAFENLTGLKNVVGKKVSEVIPGIRESSPELFEIYGRVSLTGNSEKAEIYLDSLQSWFSLSVYSPEREYFVAVFDNITERRLAEDSLHESEEKFAKVFHYAPVLITLSNIDDGTYLDVNEKFCEISGFSREESTGKTSVELGWVSPEDRKRLIEELQTHGSIREMDLMLLTRDKREIHCIYNGELIQTQNRKMLLSIAHDITELKRLEQKQLELQRKLLDAQKLESLGVMAGGVAHDFNNLLMATLGNLEFALTDLGLGPVGKKAIENAIQVTERSAELSHQMLIYSGKSLYAPKELDLGELAIKLAHEKEVLLNSVVPQSATLNFKINKGLPLIRGDEDQIQRVITNLVINASEAIGENTGEVTVRTGVIDCDESYLSRSRYEKRPEPGEFVFLEVTDTGCGMDAETQHKLFDPFFTSKFWGRGLGMAEVMGIVKGHHGAIIVESEVGKGSKIRVLFPVPKKVQDQPALVIDAVDSKAPTSESVSGRRKTVLVVDDEEFVRNMVLMRLEVLGYDTLLAVDGADGVHLFRERFNDIDLVLLDFAMPRMNGVEAFGELIRIKPDVKVILSSGYTEDVVSKSFPGPKPVGFLNKPYKLEALKAELDRLLGTDG